ncbi:MAG: hypothetical protein AB7T31_04925 [Gemmatimonadales bacterium]
MNSHEIRVISTLVSLLVIAAACGGRDEPPAEEAPAATQGGMGPMGADSAMMQEMTAQVGRMRTMSGDSMPAMLPEHRQMVGNMLAQMNADMRSMNMSGDAAWNALVDSVRADVIALPEMSATELQAAMPAHVDRVARLLGSHQAMMRAMRM